MKFLFLFLCCLLNIYGFKAERIKDKRGLEASNDYIYACGDEFMETKCKCNNAVLNCDLNGVSDLNIHVIAENFTVKIAIFHSNGITTLKKKKILPGREYSIINLSFFGNSISSIENGTFDEFKSLKELNLSYNNLTKIDENVLTENLGKTLIRLDLNMNHLNLATPRTFMFLKKLEYLGLSNNSALMPFFNKNLFSTSLANLKNLDLTWCNITTLEDDVFVNLVNLEEIFLHKNPFTIVPKALTFLPNLQSLDLSHTGLISVNKNDFGYNPKLLNLYFYWMDNLTAVGDCAFCNFPNLQKIVFWGSKKLTFLHQNAFGSFSTGKIYSKIEEFFIGRTNISLISERLIDFSKAEKLYLGTFGYTCDCSMAWLINDLENPLWKGKLKTNHIDTSSLECSNPPDLKGKNFTEVAGQICNGKTSLLYSNPPPSTSNLFHWILLSGIIFGLAILCYIYQNQIIHFINRYRKSERDDTDQLFQYRNLEADSVSM